MIKLKSPQSKGFQFFSESDDGFVNEKLTTIK